MKSVLYIFSGEKAQGAEIVIERLMNYNLDEVQAHLFIAPGDFAHQLVNTGKPYRITMLNQLRRLFRKNSKAFSFYFKALKNHIQVSYKVYRYIKKEQILVIHANNILAASYLLPVILYARVFLRNRVWVWSDHDMNYAAKVDKLIANIAVKLYDRTLVVSKAVAKKFKSDEKVTVLYNGLDTSSFKPNTEARHNFRAKLNLPHDAILLGMAAKITPGKGQAGLIEIFKKLQPVFNNIYLVIAGSFSDDYPDYNEEVKNAIHSGSKILYLGFLQDVTGYYNGCDILVSNSNNAMSESLGTTIYEAMAFEKVVVASATGGTPEIISDNVDGYLFKAEDKEELHEKLTLLLKNFSLSYLMQLAARAKVKAKFSLATMKMRYNDILKELENQ